MYKGYKPKSKEQIFDEMLKHAIDVGNEKYTESKNREDRKTRNYKYKKGD